MALSIEYKAKTEDDIADLADALLKVREISNMGLHFLNVHVPEDYYTFKAAFETIQLLIEPAITYFCYDGSDIHRAMDKRKKREK